MEEDAALIPSTRHQHTQMAGRRLLDAARILGASRSIAKQHFDIRSRQWDVYTKTSTLAKAVKSQTDRVTLTAKAAYALARRVNEKGPSYAESPGAYSTQAQHEDTSSIPRQHTVSGADGPAGQEEGLHQDHHYQPSRQNAAVEDPPRGDLHVVQEKAARAPLPDGTIPPAGADIGTPPSGQARDTFSQRPVSEPAKDPLDEQPHLDVAQQKADRYPLPDGTVPPKHAKLEGAPGPSTKDTFAQRSASEAAKDPLAGDGHASDSLEPIESAESTIPLPRSSEHAMKAQRLSEFQIPSLSGSEEAVATPGQDTYNIRPTASSPDLSSLPRLKIPKNVVDTQGTDEHVQDGQINQDVYYSSAGRPPQPPIPSQEAVPEQEEVPEGINTDVFHSPRVASLLGGSAREDRRKAYEMKMKAARRAPVDRSPLAQGRDQDTFSVRESSSTPVAEPVVETKSEENIDDLRNLAESIAHDATSSRSASAPQDSTPFQMRESRVPSSRFGRLWQYGGLATSMAFGAVGESFRRVTGGGDASVRVPLWRHPILAWCSAVACVPSGFFRSSTANRTGYRGGRT